MGWVRTCHTDNDADFASFCKRFVENHPGFLLGRLGIDGETRVRTECRGTRILWVYRGRGEVLLPSGFRTQEGDGAPLPPEYVRDPLDPTFAACLSDLGRSLASYAAAVRGPLEAVLDRLTDGFFVGDIANELWKLEHLGCEGEAVLQALLPHARKCGWSTKAVTSFEPVQVGDQLAVTADEELIVRGRLSCLSLELRRQTERRVPEAVRLRYLRDSSGGCNFDFNPFRRLPLTWQLNLPGETGGDGRNFVNSHVVNIARETSPTHFHPPTARGGGDPQNEMYLVLDPGHYGLKTYGRRAHLVAFPDLRRLQDWEVHDLPQPGTLAYIPAGTGHRGVDVFANVITFPGFKPHNEFYIDRDIAAAGGDAPYNPDLTELKNYSELESLLLR